MICLLFFAAGSAKAQQVLNSNFEAWENLGAVTEEPNNWNSFKTGTGGLIAFTSQQLKRSAVKRPGSSGTYSAVTWAKSTLGTIANGNFTTGQVNANSATPTDPSNYNATVTTNTLFNAPLTVRPDSLIVWIKFKPAGTGADSARVSAIIHANYNMRDPADAGSAAQVVGKAIKNFAKTNGAWIRKSVPFTYPGPATLQQYILITFTTNKTPGSGTAGDSLYVDDMELFYNPVLTTGTISTTTYYVSSTQGATISIPFTLTGNMLAGNVVTAQLSDATGSFASPATIGFLNTTTSGTITGTIPVGTPTGSGYRVRVVSSTYPLTAANNGTNLQIYLASNAVASAATQTIEAGTNGTVLTNSEVGVATSREWKYATAIAGPYVSFAPVETGTTLTPTFVTYGTWYINCTSNFPNSITTTSNQVQIDVVDNQIAPATTQNIDMNVAGTNVLVTEYPVGTSREWLYATASGGPYNSFSPMETATTYNPLFTTAGTYFVMCQSQISGIPVSSSEVMIVVTDVTGIHSYQSENYSVYFSDNQLNVDLKSSSLNNPTMQVYNINGQLVGDFMLKNHTFNSITMNIPAGLYMFRISDVDTIETGKIIKQ